MYFIKLQIQIFIFVSIIIWFAQLYRTPVPMLPKQSHNSISQVKHRTETVKNYTLKLKFINETGIILKKSIDRIRLAEEIDTPDLYSYNLNKDRRELMRAKSQATRDLALLKKYANVEIQEYVRIKELLKNAVSAEIEILEKYDTFFIYPNKKLLNEIKLKLFFHKQVVDSLAEFYRNQLLQIEGSVD